PLTEGALAPDPAARPRPEPLREIPGMKKRERTWKDEVRERMRDRKRRRGDGDLPLFRDGDETGDVGDDVAIAETPPPDERPAATSRPPIVRADPPPRGLARTPDLGLGSTPIDVADEADLPLRAPDLPLHSPAPPVATPGDEWMLGAEPTAAARPVERPAYSGERARAAVLDLALLTVLWAIVVYFASRAAHVGLVGLRPAWPYLAGYLAFLGLTYAGYFTGTTGQTLGKIATGLRVVDAGGRPPGYLRAFVRAALGSLGVVAAGAGLIPMLLDPARRALHDRVVKTRVVKG
ncbi:MAG TPA: RDD family protein, partial [Vicinamibacteria bacterium]|nr:RDD family protein [Vicinamibacteria bacterium]